MPMFEEARADRRRRAARSVPRRADPDQGHRRDRRRRARRPPALLPLKRANFTRRVDSHLVATLQARRLRDRRQDRTRSELGIVPAAEPPAWPPTQQPVRPHARLRRLERRLGVRGRDRHGADRARERRRRLDPDPGELLRPVRPEAEPRPGLARARASATQRRAGREHVVTRSVRDSAAVLDVLAGMLPGDPYTAPTQLAPYARRARGRRRASCGSAFATRHISVRGRRRRVASRLRRGGRSRREAARDLGHHVEPAEIAATPRSRVRAALPHDLGRRRGDASSTRLAAIDRPARRRATRSSR